jgi:3-deoxy-7-phosphoheptulonate synthase
MPRNYLTDDLRIRDVRPLISPAILIEEVPVATEAQELVAGARRAVSNAIHGEDDRLVVIVGPCSIHDPKAALEYAQRLTKIAQKHPELIVVMRTYFEKPRTVDGWKGLMNDPDLNETFQINKGLRIARQLLSDIAALGLPVACEFLDNILPQYIADFVSWVAIGARTSESQIHREFASGCSMPVGFKNNTSGHYQSALDAIRAASLSHWFPSVTKQGMSAILQTSGNDCCHIILRGGTETGPNCDPETIHEVAARLAALGLSARLMVDCSHGNSGKDHTRQGGVAREVAAQIASGDPAIFGVMLESHLKAGQQDFTPGCELEYGVSITDACVSIDETEELLAVFAEASRARNLIAARS